MNCPKELFNYVFGQAGARVPGCAYQLGLSIDVRPYRLPWQPLSIGLNRLTSTLIGNHSNRYQLGKTNDVNGYQLP